MKRSVFFPLNLGMNKERKGVQLLRYDIAYIRREVLESSCKIIILFVPIPKSFVPNLVLWCIQGWEGVEIMTSLHFCSYTNLCYNIELWRSF